MKTFAPRSLRGHDLRGLIDDLHATPSQVCKYLDVGERTLRRWLADDSAPFAVLAALWHETPAGREAAHLDTGNALVLARGLARSTGDALAAESARLARLLGISDTGAMNDPLFTGPSAPPPGSGRPNRVTSFQPSGPAHDQTLSRCR